MGARLLRFRQLADSGYGEVKEVSVADKPLDESVGKKRSVVVLVFWMLLAICSWLLIAWALGIDEAARENIAIQQSSLQQIEESKTSITETELLENVRFLSHKNMEGRGTVMPSKGGYEFPSLFLARELQEYGLKPLGDPADPKESLNIGPSRSYFQKFKVWGEVYSHNVIGFFEGENKEEVIVIGAHYDHMGKDTRGEIYYGADDNASGTAAVLEIAEALSILKSKGIVLKRSVLIAFWGAEEIGDGLLGSEYFVTHPPAEVPVTSIIAVLNLDMIGRNNPNELYVLGAPGKKNFEEVSPDLCKLTLKLNERQEFNFKLVYDDGADCFSRSDQYSFFKAKAKDKIPVIFYFTGEHPDYHTPRDTFEKLNYSKMAKITKLTFLMCWEISELSHRPIYVEESK